MTRSLNRRVAAVTGAGSGIGRGCALRLAEDTAKVAVWDINGESAEETARLIRLASAEIAAGAAPQVVFCLTCSQTLEITTEPSPTAEATRFTDPARTSPTAKMPG